jgi:uracil-DNA glycosylase
MGGKHPLADCENCPLKDRPFAPTDGPEDSKVIIVSRSPSYHDGIAGKPFSGPSGKVLNFLLQQNGVRRNDVRVTNVVLCNPKEGKVPPAAIKACAGRLQRELDHVDLVIAAGSEAVNSIIGKSSVDRARGYRHTIRHSAEHVFTGIATNNPAVVLRDDSTFPNLVKDFKRAFNPLPPPKLPAVIVLEEPNEVRDYLRDFDGHAGLVASDIETRGGLSKRATLVCVQFSTEGGSATVIGERGDVFNDRAVVNQLRSIYESAQRNFCWHNGSFDTKVLRGSYDITARIDHDTILMSYILDERPGTHSLEYLLMEEFGWPNYEPESVKKFKRTGVVDDYNDLYEYAGRDVAGTYQLYEHFRSQLDETVY